MTDRVTTAKPTSVTQRDSVKFRALRMDGDGDGNGESGATTGTTRTSALVQEMDELGR